MQETDTRDTPATPERPGFGSLFRHVDGGFYQYLMAARHSDDQGPLVVYRHLWPFDREGDAWARPKAEWDKRFTPVTAADLEAAMQADQAEAQAAVHAAKASRRAAGG